MKVEDYEKDVIRCICKDTLPSVTLDNILASPNSVEIKSCSAVYDLDIFHDDLPEELVVCDDSMTGNYKGVEVGFVVTILNRCLTLECYAIGDGTVPEEIRHGTVHLSEP